MSQFMMSMADYAKVCRKAHKLFIERKDDEAKAVLSAACKFPVEKEFLDKAVLVFHHQLTWNPGRGDPVCDWIHEARRESFRSPENSNYPWHFVPLALAVLTPTGGEGKSDEMEENLSTGIYTIRQTSTVVGKAVVVDPVLPNRTTHSVYNVHGVRSWPSAWHENQERSYNYERTEQIGGNGGTCYTRLTRNFSAKKDNPKVAAVLAVLTSMKLNYEKKASAKKENKNIRYVVLGEVAVWDEKVLSRRYVDPNFRYENEPPPEDPYPPLLESSPEAENSSWEKYHQELGRVMEQPWPLPKSGTEIDPTAVGRMSIQSILNYSDKRNTTTFIPIAVVMDAVRDKAEEVGLRVKFTWSLHSPYRLSKEIREFRISITMSEG